VKSSSDEISSKMMCLCLPTSTDENNYCLPIHVGSWEFFSVAIITAQAPIPFVGRKKMLELSQDKVSSS
jgi:hypothetical protein